MIVGLGTDIVEIGRIEQAWQRHGRRFLEHVFTENEQAYCQRYTHFIPHYAGRFAAKEAVLKALGTGITAETGWLDVEIQSDLGKPVVVLTPRLQTRFPKLSFFLSISHSDAYAMATAISVGS